MGAIPKVAMRSQVSGLIHDNGGLIRVKRQSATLTTSKRLSGSFVSSTTIEGWLQPYDGRARNATAGVIAETTDIVFLPYGTVAINAKTDRLLPVGDTYQYDVLAETTLDTHKEVYLKRVARA